ncbi:MAG: beta-1,6-N-acetylglucosaminyltransferase [Siphonobacter sp.]
MKEYKIAYVILVHKLPAQARRVVERLSGYESKFWIHVDTHSDIKLFEKEFSLLPNVAFIKKRYHTRWGHFDFVRAYLQSIREIKYTGYKYDHLIFLSGQDYPLVSRQTLINFLAQNRSKSFVHFTKMNRTEHDHLWERLEKYHLFLPYNQGLKYPYQSEQPLKRITDFVFKSTGLFTLPRRVPLNMEPYFGSNWVRLTPKAADFVLSIIENNPKIQEFFNHMLLSDEHFFQTLLLNATEEERGEIVNHNFTFTHWKRPSEWYSVPLGMRDLELLKNSGDFFARKFDETYDRTILNWFDKNSL